MPLVGARARRRPGRARAAAPARAGQGHDHRPLGADGRGHAGAAAHLSRRVPGRRPRRAARQPPAAASSATGRTPAREVIADFGERHIATGDLIVYTSADSVLQIAAHEDVVPLAELYAACAAAREIMTGEHAVGRVIARPFRGEPGAFERTEGRRDLALDPPARSYLEELQAAGVPVHTVGKIGQVFNSVGVDEQHKGSTNAAAIAATDGADRRPRRRVRVRQPRRDRPGLRPPQRRRGLPRRAARDRRRGRGVAAAAGPRARPARPHRRPRLSTRRIPAPTTRASTCRCSPASPATAAAATTARSPTSAPRSCAGSPAATPRCRARRSCRDARGRPPSRRSPSWPAAAAATPPRRGRPRRPRRRPSAPSRPPPSDEQQIEALLRDRAAALEAGDRRAYAATATGRAAAPRPRRGGARGAPAPARRDARARRIEVDGDRARRLA